MAQKPLSEETLRRAAEAVQRYGSVREAARQLNVSDKTLAHQVNEAKRKLGLVVEKPEPVYAPVPDDPSEPEPDGPSHSTLFDERWETFTRWIGKSEPGVPCARIANHERRVIFQTGDWHEPFIVESAFQAAVDANRDADICMVGGDALNACAFSRFIETAHVRPQDEFERLTRRLQALAQMFPEVRVNIGNHPERIKKYFGKRIDPWAMFLVQINPIEFIVDGLRSEGVTNIYAATPVIDDLDTSNWLTLIGDCAFTHGETHGKLSTRPAENVAKWLRRWERKLPMRPRVIVQEHNHRGAMVYDEELQALLIQAPCLSQDVSYQTGADLKYGPNQHGWVRIVQDSDGRTIINESRYYLVDESGAERVA